SHSKRASSGNSGLTVAMVRQGLAGSTSCQPVLGSSAPHGPLAGKVVDQNVLGSGGRAADSGAQIAITRVLATDSTPRFCTCTYRCAVFPDSGGAATIVPAGQSASAVGQT